MKSKRIMKKAFNLLKSKSISIIFMTCISFISCNNRNTNNTNTVDSPTSASGNVLKMKLSAIVDNQVTKGDAVMFLLPQGWQQKSQLDWDVQNTQFPASGELHVNNPDNSAQLHIYKTSFYTLSNQAMQNAGIGLGSKYMGGTVVASMPANTIQATMQTLNEMNVLPSDLKILETKVIKIESTNPIDIQAQKQNPQVQFISDNVISKGIFSKDGENYTVLINAYVNGTINNSLNFSNWQVLPIIFIVKQDDAEKANTELCQAILKSIRYTPAFLTAQTQVIKYLTDQYYQGLRNIAAISQQISRNNDAMIASIDKSYEKANSTYKPTNDGFSQYIKGVENYADESGGTYELPSTYNTAWKNGNGEIILSNESGYNPNADASTGTQNWEELKK